MSPKRLLIVVLLAALGWSVFWVVAAMQTRAQTQAWMEARRAEGWQADWSRVSVAGFPNRLDRTIHDPALADPGSGWAWEADWLQILGLVYRSDRVIVVLPPEQRLATPEEKMRLTGGDLRASIDLGDGPERTVAAATAVLKDLSLVSDAGWEAAADEIRLATRHTVGRAGAMDIGFEAFGFRPPKGVVATLSRANLAPAEVERLSADVAVTLDGPLSLEALETARPQPTALDIREIRAVWGKLDLAVAGQLTVGPDGRPEGEVLVKARNWRAILDLGRQAGLLPGPLADTVEGALGMVAGLAGRSETLDVPLTFRNGRTLIGPVPIGPAPVIRLP